MIYFVTGATGFIGKRLVAKLLEKPASTVYFLTRDKSPERIEKLLAFWATDKSRAIPIVGDLLQPCLGVGKGDIKKLKGKIDHFFHLAAVYDLGASADAQMAANVDGTRNTVDLAMQLEVGCFHHVSSIAAAGLFEGVFREDMFEEAENLEHPYFGSKHESEKIVRNECKRPWRVYRPGVVVGDSQTGEMDKIDGPYYFFKLIQKMRKILPPWMPAIGIEGGRINIVPVDYVVAAMHFLAHKKGLDRQAFHLTDPNPRRVGDVLNIFARAGHAPEMAMRINAALFGFIPRGVKKSLMALTPVRRIQRAVMKDLGLPEDILQFVNYPTRFDNRETEKALTGSGISVPKLEDYAWKLWDYVGAPPRSRPVHRPQPARPCQRQSGAGHRRFLGHRQGRGLQAGGGRCDRHHRRPRHGKDQRNPGRSQNTRTANDRLLDRRRRRAAVRRTDRQAQRRSWRCRHPGEQCRTFDPARHRDVLRPLP